MLNGPSDSRGAPTSALRFFLNGVDQVKSACCAYEMWFSDVCDLWESVYGNVVGAQVVLNGPSDSSGAPTSALRFFFSGVDQV